jgi:peptidoglycan/xylan/chitin deacetylase (PgdA/CDA1 family)
MPRPTTAPTAAPGGTLPAATPGATLPPAASLASAVPWPTGVPWPSSVPAPGPLYPGLPSASFVLDVPVLMYHRIAPPAEVGDSIPGLVVNPTVFAAQLTAFKQAGWHTVTAAELAAYFVAGRHPPRRTFVVTFDDGHEDGYTHAFPILLRLGFVATYYVITDRIGRTGYLQPTELQAMAAAGMEVGSHTINHATLTRLAPTRLALQLTLSGSQIARVLGAPPVSLAYPRGTWNSAVARATATAGYAVAFTEGPGCGLRMANRFASPRLRVGPGTTPAVILAKATACGG